MIILNMSNIGWLNSQAKEFYRCRLLIDR